LFAAALPTSRFLLIGIPFPPLLAAIILSSPLYVNFNPPYGCSRSTPPLFFFLFPCMRRASFFSPTRQECVCDLFARSATFPSVSRPSPIDNPEKSFFSHRQLRVPFPSPQSPFHPTLPSPGPFFQKDLFFLSATEDFVTLNCC